MSQLATLLKIDLINSLSVNKLKSRNKTSAMKKSPLVAGVISALFIFAVLLYYSYMIAKACSAVSKPETMITYGVGSGGMVCLLLTLSRSNGVLFQSKDFELLSAMPIKTKTIATSKFLNLIIINYCYFNATFIPSLVFYMIFNGYTISCLLIGILIALIGPIFPTIVCAFISYFIGRILANFKYKNMVSTIISVGFVVLVLIGSFSLSYGTDSMTDEEANLFFVNRIDSMFNKYFLAGFCTNILNGKYLYLLYFLLISIVPLIIFIIFYGKNFVRINSNIKEGYKNQNFNLKKSLEKDNKQKQTNQLLVLIKREFKMFVSNNVYITNVIVGPIMSIIVTILVCTQKQNLFSTLDSSMASIVPIAIIGGYALTLGLTPSTNCALSIEGKGMWLLKISPISPKKILLAKCLMYILLCLPFTIVNVILAKILINIDIKYMIFMFLISTIIVIAFSFMGMWINSLNPKFDWTNPAQVVKQSSGTLITMLVDFVLEVVIFLPSMLFEVYFNGTGLYILLAISSIIAILSILLVFTNSVKRYERMEI